MKICGLKTREEVSMAVKANADAVGFVTEVPVDTHRDLDAGETRELAGYTPPFISTVAVTMPEDVPEAEKIYRETGVDVLQIHSGLDPGQVRELRQQIPADLVRKVGSTREAERFEEVVDALLLDSSGEKGRGGTGEEFDRGEAAEIARKAEVPIILAGGLTPENVGEAIEDVSPDAVDVSSGVEEDGKKQSQKIEDFVSSARGVSP
ncbi:MAG: phosphoribosylanthranilate isomerase [Candidatus Nanohaloarchaea archaeon]